MVECMKLEYGAKTAPQSPHQITRMVSARTILIVVVLCTVLFLNWKDNSDVSEKEFLF